MEHICQVVYNGQRFIRTYEDELFEILAYEEIQQEFIKHIVLRGFEIESDDIEWEEIFEDEYNNKTNYRQDREY